MKQKPFLTILAGFFLIFSFSIAFANSYSKGMSQFMKKNYDEAKSLLNSAIEEDPTNGNAYYYLGEIEKNTRNYRTATEFYLKALENRLSSKYVNLTYWNLIIITEQQSDYHNMVKTCKTFYRKTGDPGAKSKVDNLINKMLWTNNQNAITEYQLGKSALQNGTITQAQNYFQNALNKDSQFLAARFELGMISHKAGKPDTAVQHLKVIADKIPFYTPVQQITADIYLNYNEWNSAKRYYSNVIEYGFINQNTLRTTLIKRGQCYFKLRRFTDAENDIKKALSIKDGTAPKRVLSAIYIQNRKYDDALQILEELKQSSPANPDIHYQIGSIYYKQKDSQYLNHFNTVYKLTSNLNDIPKKYQKAYKILAKEEYAQQNYISSTAIFWKIDPLLLSYDEKIAAATSYYNTKNYTKAKDTLSSVLLTDRDKILLSKTYVKTGQIENAKAVLQPLVIRSIYKDDILKDPVLQAVANDILEEERERRERINSETQSNDTITQ
jgi:tetratricopeptide (TPR) repeat protein